MESKLDRTARYKSWDVYPRTKTITWITQETNEQGSKDAAMCIANELADQPMFQGWTIKVASRDEWPQDQDDPRWMSYAVDKNTVQAEPVLKKLS